MTSLTFTLGVALAVAPALPTLKAALALVRAVIFLGYRRERLVLLHVWEDGEWVNLDVVA